MDGFRHLRPSYYHVKMIYSPIKVGSELERSQGSLSFTVTNCYSFTDLSELALRWSLLQKGKAVAAGKIHRSIAPRTAGPVHLDADAAALAGADAVRLDFVHPDGPHVVSHQFTLAAPPVVSGLAATLPEGLAFPHLNLVVNRTERDSAKWRRIPRFYGSLTNIQTVPASARGLYARPLSEVRSVQADIVLDNKPAAVVGHLRANWHENQFTYRIDWTGDKADIQELGWIFTMPHRMDHFSWKRQARWSVYPDDHIGRAQGTALPASANVHILNWNRCVRFHFHQV